MVGFSVFRGVLISPSQGKHSIFYGNLYAFGLWEEIRACDAQMERSRAGIKPRTFLSWGKWAILCAAMMPLLCNVLSFRFDWFVCRHAPPPRPTGGAESTTITTVGECQECCQGSAWPSSVSGGVTFPFCHPLALSPASHIVVQN